MTLPGRWRVFPTGVTDPLDSTLWAITWDGDNTWVLSHFDAEVYEVSLGGGTVGRSFAVGQGIAFGFPYGVAWNGTNLVVAWRESALARTRLITLTRDGNLVDVDAGPDDHPRGISWDGSHYWLTTFGAGSNDRKVWQLNADFSVADSWSFTGDRYGVVRIDSSLWFSAGASLLRADLSDPSTIVDTHSSPHDEPGESAMSTGLAVANGDRLVTEYDWGWVYHIPVPVTPGVVEVAPPLRIFQRDDIPPFMRR